MAGGTPPQSAEAVALAGSKSVIPADEVIDAMQQSGQCMPAALRETSGGGLAQTPTALAITERLACGEKP